MEFIRPFQQRIMPTLRVWSRLNLTESQGLTASRAALKASKHQQAYSLHTSSWARLATRHSLWSKAFARRTRNVRWQSSKPPSPNPTENLGSPQPQTLAARMRKLSREYGWAALGVYLGLSALDFPFCFLAVRWLGTDRIGRWEHIVLETVWQGIEKVYPNARTAPEVADAAVKEGDAWGVEEADARNKSDSASLWTQLALAYAIHKSFIFIRVPLTAAITPKVVKTLRSWGINIGKRRPKS